MGPAPKYYVMGILNVTPDSFYDGAKYGVLEKGVERAFQLIEEGADILDIGGESTRPGSERVLLEEELKRVIPLIERLAKETTVPISVDTYKSEVAQRAIDVGASVVNDISGLTMDRRMVKVVAATGVRYVLTHIQGTPKQMQLNPVYEDVVKDIYNFFKKQIEWALSQGISEKQIIIDPGIGFGKTIEHNIELLRSLDAFLDLGFPVMIGASRKSFIGKIQCDLKGSKGDGPKQRLSGSLAVAVWGYMKGGTYFRVHDVLETRRALTMIEHLRGA